MKKLFSLFFLLFPALLFAEMNPYLLGSVGGGAGFYKCSIDADYVDSSLTDYVVTVDFSEAASFPFTDVASKNDIVFMDSTKTQYLKTDWELDYDSSEETGVCHVRMIDTVDDTTDTEFYIAYNSGVTIPDEPDTVWADYIAVYHMGDWSSNDGIMVDSAYGVSAAVSGPSAYHYSGTHDRTYWSYLCSDGNIKIRYYDHDADDWSAASTIAANSIWAGYPDSHGMVAVTVDNSGYIHVAGANHSTANKYWISNSAEDISAWTAQADLSTDSTYSSWIKHSGGNLYSIYRGRIESTNRRPVYFKCYSGSWGSETKIIEVNSDNQWRYICYPAYDSSNQRIWFAWRNCNASESDGAKQSTKLYCGYLDVSGGATHHHMFSYDGDDLGASVSDAEADTYCLITNGTSSFYIWQPLVKLDTSGNPYVMYPRSTDTDSDEWDTVWKYWTGSEWTSEYWVENANGWWTQLTFSVSSSSNATAYLMDENKNPRKKVWNGSVWSTEAILEDLQALGSSWGMQYVEDYQDDLMLLWDLSGVVVGLDSNDDFVPLSSFSIDGIQDQSPNSFLQRKAGSSSPIEAVGTLGNCMSFNGSSDYTVVMNQIFDWTAENGTVQVLAKMPTVTDISSSSRCLISMNAENGDGDGHIELTIKDANAGQAYDGRLYAKVAYETDGVPECYGDTYISSSAPLGDKRVASSDSNSYVGYGWGRYITVPSGGWTVDNISVYCNPNTPGNLYLEIWTDSSTSPGSLVSGSSVAVSPITSSLNENIGTLSSPVFLSAGNYWIVAREWGWNEYRPGAEGSLSGQKRAYVPLNASGNPNAAWTVVADPVQYCLNIYGYAGSVSKNSYRLLGMSEDSSNGFKLWVDGEAEALTYIAGSSASKYWLDNFDRGGTDATYWYIGKRVSGATTDSYYSNYIDEVRFQDHERTAAEWKADYHGLVAKDLVIYGN